ncbi:MAG TPA: heterodisulfide reductase-related iron-sulfur binding cluster, partial [Burkholderiales bacterium]|nr:heterodisulfide reductase-related iron-sulfur binding cluster [Burkholderiales bacterium]
MSEGSLEAPTRHPLDWKNPEFWNQEKAEKELERIFDICHGCRRCVSLCTAFPTLFDLVDASPTLEVDGVKKEDYWKVVDQCYLCDLCYMTKCPYVPPHPWNVDFPHVMLRAKAIKFRKGRSSNAPFRDRLLSSTDAMGKLAAIPVVAQTVNLLNSNSLSRTAMQGVLGVHKDRELPPYAPRKFRSAFKDSNKTFPAKDGKSTPGKVAIFATCYANFNEPVMGHDLVAILEHNEIPYVLVEKEACCGMPKFELGDLEGVD